MRTYARISRICRQRRPVRGEGRRSGRGGGGGGEGCEGHLCLIHTSCTPRSRALHAYNSELALGAPPHLVSVCGRALVNVIDLNARLHGIHRRRWRRWRRRRRRGRRRRRRTRWWARRWRPWRWRPWRWRPWRCVHLGERGLAAARGRRQQWLACAHAAVEAYEVGLCNCPVPVLLGTQHHDVPTCAMAGHAAPQGGGAGGNAPSPFSLPALITHRRSHCAQ
jgi:hypothetical protein